MTHAFTKGYTIVTEVVYTVVVFSFCSRIRPAF